MKYKCDMIRDLMPLCVDDAANEVSRKAVVDHIAECKECEQYYSKVINEISVNSECLEESKGYVTIAKKLRRRKIFTRAITAFIICIVLELLLNYAVGYRFAAESAASLSGRLNASSELVGNYDWGDWQFYIYNSANSYDVVTVRKYWNGWKAQDNYLVWPKYVSDEGGIINAGCMYYWTDAYNKFGIQIFPIIAEDTDVARVSVTVFNKTQTVDVETNKLAILTIENADPLLRNEASGYAYDSEGNILYELVQSEETMRWMWQKVNE
jgi:hypothetical protein